MVEIETSKGNIVIELEDGKAPKTVENFLRYVDEGYYDGTVFHRVIDGFVIQGGGMEPGLRKKPGLSAPIQNEANNGLNNTRGSIAMARTSDPHSASSQFFINLVDNAFLNHTAETPQGWGYAVFGNVLEGMDVVDAIGKVATGEKGKDVPNEDVVLIKASRKS